MDEIYYIAEIDARPWRASPAIGAAIPLALFLASVEIYRRELNVTVALPDWNRYFVIIFLVVLGLYISKYFRNPWRDAYTKKLLINTIYLGLISTGAYNALAHFSPINHRLVDLESYMNAWLDRWYYGNEIRSILITVVTCAVGGFYLWLRTTLNSRKETTRLENRPSAHIFRYYRAKETQALIWIYSLYMICTIAVISFLVIA